MKLWRGKITLTISTWVYANSEQTARELLQCDLDQTLIPTRILASHFHLDCFESPLTVTQEYDFSDQISEHRKKKPSTPEWLVEPILNRLMHHPISEILEPACGDGAVVRILQRRFPHAEIVATDIAHGRQFDFLTMQPHPRFDLIITNPPCSLALEFVKRAMLWRHSGLSHVAMLLRLGFLARQKRASWLRKHTPSLYVSPRRPSFAHNGKSDNSEYAWFVWGPMPPRVEILETEARVDTLLREPGIVSSNAQRGVPKQSRCS